MIGKNFNKKKFVCLWVSLNQIIFLPFATWLGLAMIAFLNKHVKSEILQVTYFQQIVDEFLLWKFQNLQSFRVRKYRCLKLYIFPICSTSSVLKSSSKLKVLKWELPQNGRGTILKSGTPLNFFMINISKFVADMLSCYTSYFC